MRGGAADAPSMVTVPASESLNVMTAEDSISDDVFEMDDDRASVTNVLSSGLTPAARERPLEKTPSPTGYRDYKPPAEVLGNNYSTTFRATRDFDSVRSTLKRDHEKEDNFTHKTILLGDSGVGKTSLLVQFDTGRFQPGNFAATVGIGFTVSASCKQQQRGRLHGARHPRAFAFVAPRRTGERERGRKSRKEAKPRSSKPRDTPNFHSAVSLSLSRSLSRHRRRRRRRPLHSGPSTRRRTRRATATREGRRERTEARGRRRKNAKEGRKRARARTHETKRNETRSVLRRRKEREREREV
ncbi:U1 small nuclear ribonucleoprotein 70 kDa isoform X3 [Harpegnathos saltator]|uniref:U1 small nuclear ribonucleoprotein 70 kDa isoform X3 n=1 Tax=Harpegnathos saltator TaxID=610380 RepID=UPI000DBED818|nr:U1 small nuclear ribonucleoprotein 70 kDa isoform X3 [Harpegnathos saltator]